MTGLSIVLGISLLSDLFLLGFVYYITTKQSKKREPYMFDETEGDNA